MIEGLGVHGADDGDVVCVGANVREDVGHFGAGLTVFLEFEFWPEEIVLGVDKGGLVVLEEFGGRFGAIEPGEFGFVVEEIEVAGGSAHEEVDDVFSLSPEVGILGRHGIKVPGIGAGFEGCEGDGAEAEAAVFHEPAAGVGALEVWDDVGWEVHGKEDELEMGRLSGWGGDIHLQHPRAFQPHYELGFVVGFPP